MQCSKFLDRHGSWQQIGAANTAVAAKKILNENDPTQAAICSEHAAEIYGLKILEEKIESQSQQFYQIYCGNQSEDFSEEGTEDQYLL